MKKELTMAGFILLASFLLWIWDPEGQLLGPLVHDLFELPQTTLNQFDHFRVGLTHTQVVLAIDPSQKRIIKEQIKEYFETNGMEPGDDPADIHRGSGAVSRFSLAPLDQDPVDSRLSHPDFIGNNETKVIPITSADISNGLLGSGDKNPQPSSPGPGAPSPSPGLQLPYGLNFKDSVIESAAPQLGSTEIGRWDEKLNQPVPQLGTTDLTGWNQLDDDSKVPQRGTTYLLKWDPGPAASNEPPWVTGKLVVTADSADIYPIPDSGSKPVARVRQMDILDRDLSWEDKLYYKVLVKGKDGFLLRQKAEVSNKIYSTATGEVTYSP